MVGNIMYNSVVGENGVFNSIVKCREITALRYASRVNLLSWYKAYFTLLLYTFI